MSQQLVVSGKSWINMNNEVFDMHNGIQTTEFFDDFLNYYNKAKLLQQRNELLLPNDTQVDDPLMMNVSIYDCVERRQAGFCNALEDIHGKRSPSHSARLPKFKLTHEKSITRFIHLFHRFTGSGASFEHDHGYRNNHVGKLCEIAEAWYGIDDPFLGMKQYIVGCKEPMVTSIGNQPPSLKNGDSSKYRLAMQYYFDNFAEDFIYDYSKFLNESGKFSGGPMPIKNAVDFCCKWHKDRGFKQWKFVLTAFVMDDAEYYPEDVDPNSHCYFGSNCLKAFNLMFTKPDKRMDKQKWHDACMEILCNKTGGQPYSLEDVACDMIRYWTEYVPKNGYSHLTQDQIKNNSSLKINGEYPIHIKELLTKELGYYKYEKNS